jgi:hypothetical protein
LWLWCAWNWALRMMLERMNNFPGRYHVPRRKHR